MVIEESPYAVVKASGIFELRDYEPHILAETVVDGTLEDAPATERTGPWTKLK